MKYLSTRNKKLKVNPADAVFRSLPQDNGLYMPAHIPQLDPELIKKMPTMSLPEVGFHVLSPFFTDIPKFELKSIIGKALSFEIPLKRVNDNSFCLELFHGPTLAFKDVGAGFMAGCLNYYAKNSSKRVSVLVATSGDTGSAVANGFIGNENIDVTILYPQGRISDFQEKQMTTLGKNITAIAINGNFDDCQQMVKKAFLDKDLSNQLLLTSANSINIARLFAQSVYYFWAWTQWTEKSDPIISVPCGNLGNLTAGILAKKMGLPIKHFIASNNINRTFTDYLETGNYVPRESLSTVSNAMDVGDPSNFQRIESIYSKDADQLSHDISAYSYNDKETTRCINETFKSSGYILDPHGAVAYLGLRQYQMSHKMNQSGIFLGTAHPYKFGNTVEKAINSVVPTPTSALQFLEKEPAYIEMDNDFSSFREFLTK